jgi:hypothetical protein
MSAPVQLTVASQEQFEATISSYLGQRYKLTNRTPTTAMLLKKKHFSWFWAILWALILLLPLIIYLIIYVARSDQLVTITLIVPAAATSTGKPQPS